MSFGRRFRWAGIAPCQCLEICARLVEEQQQRVIDMHAANLRQHVQEFPFLGHRIGSACHSRGGKRGNSEMPVMLFVAAGDAAAAAKTKTLPEPAKLI